MSIPIKTPAEIEIMTQGGKVLGEVLQKVLAEVTPGVTTLKLDQLAEDLILKSGARPSFKMEKGYHFATCMCVNDMVVHGLPTSRPLVEGDILGVDLGVYFRGFHTDGSWTVEIANGERRIENKNFLKTGELALQKAIESCTVGNRVGDISKIIQEIVEGAGYSCVKQLVGHGVGRKLHEDPEVPCYLRGKIENTPLLKEGMVLAVEVIYNEGKSPVVYQNHDGWTIVTADGTNSGLFEHTVAITPSGPKVLTVAKGSGALV